MSSSPTAPTSTTGSSTCSPSPRWLRTALTGPEHRVALVACGALAQPAAAIAARLGWPLDVHPLPPLLHNRPERIAGEVRRVGPAADVPRRSWWVRRLRHLRRARPGLRGARAGPAGGAALLRPLRRRGRAGPSLFDEQPGTYLLTDFLVRSFARTVLQELGLDRWPELRDATSGTTRGWCGWPRSRTPSCGRWPRAADRLGLPLTVVETGDRAWSGRSPRSSKAEQPQARSRRSRSSRQASVAAIWLKVNTCSPSTPAFGRGQLGGALLEEPLAGEAAGGGQPGQRPLVLDQEPGGLPHADLGRHRHQLGPLDRTRQAEQQRHGDPAVAHPPHPARIVAGSKVRLLTTWVAYRRLSHIDCTVRSSVMVGCDSG